MIKEIGKSIFHSAYSFSFQLFPFLSFSVAHRVSSLVPISAISRIYSTSITCSKYAICLSLIRYPLLICLCDTKRCLTSVITVGCGLGGGEWRGFAFLDVLPPFSVFFVSVLLHLEQDPLQAGASSLMREMKEREPGRAANH